MPGPIRRPGETLHASGPFGASPLAQGYEAYNRAITNAALAHGDARSNPGVLRMLGQMLDPRQPEGLANIAAFFVGRPGLFRQNLRYQEIAPNMAISKAGKLSSAMTMQRHAELMGLDPRHAGRITDMQEPFYARNAAQMGQMMRPGGDWNVEGQFGANLIQDQNIPLQGHGQFPLVPKTGKVAAAVLAQVLKDLGWQNPSMYRH